MRLGLIQHACPPDRSREENVEHAVGMIHQAAAGGATLVATQELFTGFYFPQTENEFRFDLAESIPGPTTDRLCSVARERQITITASLFEKRAQGLYHNTSVMIDPRGTIMGKYRKMHIPDDPRFFEKYYFTPGDLGWKVFETERARAGLLVCWDQWYPEAARLTCLAGAQILFYPTAIGWYHGETPEDRVAQRESWITIQRSHAISNGVYVAAINRVGVEDDLTFWGSSFVCDPWGRIVQQADPETEQVLIVDCDLDNIETARRGWPFLRDRRIDAYQDLCRRYVD
ncbi:MAG: carbon-nitrogen hydrolase [Planctomycetales bacterium]|nr:carbon-nitrogen hydrolase [Planctomycetales bacterium]